MVCTHCRAKHDKQGRLNMFNKFRDLPDGWGCGTDAFDIGLGSADECLMFDNAEWQTFFRRGFNAQAALHAAGGDRKPITRQEKVELCRTIHHGRV